MIIFSVGEKLTSCSVSVHVLSEMTSRESENLQEFMELWRMKVFVGYRYLGSQISNDSKVSSDVVRSIFLTGIGEGARPARIGFGKLCAYSDRGAFCLNRIDPTLRREPCAYAWFHCKTAQD
jgi:hypothetical protein